MPTEDGRAERCSLHAGSPAVAICDGCRRALCLACAIPVRGLVYGAECLPGELAEDPLPVARRPLDAAARWAGAGFAIACAGTLLPWTRFGRGSGAFGAWNLTWSGAAALAFALGALVWLLARTRTIRMAPTLLIALAAAGLAAIVLALVRPPVFARPWVGLWIGGAGGVLALGASILGRRGASARAPARGRAGVG